MRMMRFAGQLTLVLALAAGVPVAAAAQTSVTTADIQRLQDTIYDASREVGADPRPRLHARVAAPGGARRRARRSDLSESETPQERAGRPERVPDLRDRIENIRSRARSDVTGRAAPSGGTGSTRRPGPVGSTGRISDRQLVPDSSRNRVRRPADDSAQFRNGAGRRPVRSDDDRRSAAGRSRPRARRVGDARRRQLGQEGGAARTQGQPDGGLRSDHGSTAVAIRFARR